MQLDERMGYYIDWLADLDDRTQGDIDKMSLQEKYICRGIMINIKKELDKLNDEYYPILESWANFNIEDWILGQREPSMEIRRLFRVV